jgi:hypothetical protein
MSPNDILAYRVASSRKSSACLVRPGRETLGVDWRARILFTDFFVAG